MKIELNETEQELVATISKTLESIKATLSSSKYDSGEVGRLYEEMGTDAHTLHLSLSSRGFPPKHHRYMVPNRRLDSDHPDFYKHIHPTEDLLAFLQDDHANDDPEDQTLGHQFTMSIHSRRWGHHDTYSIRRTTEGWEVQFTHSGPCDKGGNPFLYSNFLNDRVYYPAALEGRMEWLWMKAAEEGLSHDAVQNALNELADWINVTSSNAPSGDLWSGC